MIAKYPQRRKTTSQVDYIGEFSSKNDSQTFRQEVDSLLSVIDQQMVRGSRDSGLYSHGMGDLPVLTRQEEERCFHVMNLLKFKLYQHQNNRIGLKRDFSDFREREQQIQTIRDYLIYSNLRLVISLVKKYVSPQFSFDELYSEGVVTLMQAVEKFNYQKGFRFSTYAYRSISRAFYNLQLSLQQEQTVVAQNNEAWIDSVAQPDRSSTKSDSWWHNKRECLAKLVLRLDRREQLIVRARYALTPRGTIKTFQTIADKLGISKERVRQLEQRALQKLQTMASEVEMV